MYRDFVKGEKMEQNKKLSVIVPVYNVAGYLERSVDCLLRQTYQNLEIILVDDGSTDGSSELCDRFAQKDLQRIKVIHKANGGLSDARNMGMKHATGEYIAFLDSDDYLHHCAYEIMIHHMETLGADIVEGEYWKVTDQQEDREYWGCGVDICTRNQALVKMMRWESFDISVWNKVYKRETVEGIDFPVGKIHEDEFWTYKTYFRAKKLLHVYFPVYYYQQQRSGSILATAFSEKNYHSTEALLERIEYVKKNAPELLDEANISFLTHIYFHLQNFVLNEKRPAKEWEKYFDYYAKMLLEVPDDIMKSYTALSKRKATKVRYSKALIRISPKLFRFVFKKIEKRLYQ